MELYVSIIKSFVEALSNMPLSSILSLLFMFLAPMLLNAVLRHFTKRKNKNFDSRTQNIIPRIEQGERRDSERRKPTPDFKKPTPHRVPETRGETRQVIPDLQRQEQRPKTPTREERKGQRGENAIADILYENVRGNFRIFQNVYVPYSDATSEIDLLMVHEQGIFVFESKNYNGWIFGRMEERNWTQRFPNGETYTFYNPIKQNRSHIKALLRYLGISGDFVYSCIVFSDHCELKKVPGNTNLTIITQNSRLMSNLNHIFSTTPALRYNKGEIQKIADRLIPLTNVDSSVKEQHIENIRRVQESNVCPWCGNTLVLREGRYGSFFWGCASYPRCTFTRSVLLR